MALPNLAAYSARRRSALSWLANAPACTAYQSRAGFSSRRANHFDANLADAWTEQPNLPGGRLGQINDAASHERTAIDDSYIYRLIVREISYF